LDRCHLTIGVYMILATLMNSLRRYVGYSDPGLDRLCPLISDPNYYVLKSVKKAILRFTERYLNGREGLTFLDYGCGDAPYETLFGPYAAHYLKADLKDNINVHISFESGEKLSVNDESCDIVLSFSVLEHVQDVDGYLKEAYRILGPEGELIVTTHGTWQYHPHPLDLRRWTSSGLKYEIEKNGFQVVDMIPCVSHFAYGTLMRCKWIVDKYINPIGRPGKILKILIVPVYQLKIYIEDMLTEEKYKMHNSLIYVLYAKKSTYNV